MSDGTSAPNRQEFTEHWNRLSDDEHKVQDELDRTLLTLIGGALSISIPFIHEVAPRPVHTGWVAAGWLSLLIALLALVFSHKSAKKAHKDARDIHYRKTYEGANAEHNWWNDVTEWLNTLALLGLVAGLSFLAWFAYINLPKPTPAPVSTPQSQPAAPANQSAAPASGLTDGVTGNSPPATAQDRSRGGSSSASRKPPRGPGDVRPAIRNQDRP